MGSLTLPCISSRISCRLLRTRRALSRLAIRRLIRRRSCSVNSGAFGSPLYAIGRPTFFFSFCCKLQAVNNGLISSVLHWLAHRSAATSIAVDDDEQTAMWKV